MDTERMVLKIAHDTRKKLRGWQLSRSCWNYCHFCYNWGMKVGEQLQLKIQY